MQAKQQGQQLHAQESYARQQAEANAAGLAQCHPNLHTQIERA